MDDWCSVNIVFDIIRYFLVDVVKIDNRCIENVVFDKSVSVIIKGIIEIVYVLKIRVIVEGIEILFYYRVVKEFGCDFV